MTFVLFGTLSLNKHKTPIKEVEAFFFFILNLFFKGQRVLKDKNGLSIW